MKILFILILFSFCQLSIAGTTKKKSLKDKNKTQTQTQDKVYSVEKTSPEIIIGEPAESKSKDHGVFKRPAELWYVGIIRSSLHYQLPSVTAQNLSFSPYRVGVVLGKKIEDQFFLYKGYYEISGEWHRFERNSALGNSSLYTQKLDLYQINAFQNMDLAWVLKHKLFFSAGLGVAPVFLTTEQSVLGNSTSEFGFMGMLKTNMVFPLKKKYEIDLALKIGWGAVGGHKISTTALNLGLNFE